LAITRQWQTPWNRVHMTAATGYLGIDVGGTKVALRGEGDGVEPLEASFRWPDGGDAAADLSVLSEQVGALLDRWGRGVDAVGVAMPATLDQAGRVVSWPTRPGWVGVDPGAALRGFLTAAEVRCADDGDLAAFAEASATGADDVVYLGVGTGVGGGIVVDGRPCPGLAKGSCEIGHLVIDRSGPLCDCGRRGCVQALASGPATLRRAARLRGGGPVEFATLRQGWLVRAPWAVPAVEETCDALAVAAVGLSELLHPAAVVVGGGFADGLPGFVAEIQRRVVGLARPGHAPVPVRTARYGGLSSLRGAMLLARDARLGAASGAVS
jgi:kanosamine 6-kinase